MFSSKTKTTKKSEDVKKSAGKVLDAKKDTPTRAKHLRLFLDNAEPSEILLFFENHYSHVFFIVYDAFIGAEINLRQKGAHKAQREELESVLYLLEKVLLFLPEHLGRKWQYHAVGRLMSKLLHPGNSWKLIKREAMRLFLLWYQILGDVAGEHLHAMFATLVPGFPSPYQGLGLTALAAMTPDIQDGPVNPAEICPLIPPQSGERLKSAETDLTRIFLDVLLELMVSQVPLIEWKEDVREDRQRQCFDFMFERFKMYYMPHIFPEFNWHMSLYRPSLELPEVRRFRPAFIDTGDGTKKMDPMLACRVVVIKWVAQYTHLTRNNSNIMASTLDNSIGGHEMVAAANSTLNMSNGALDLNSHHDQQHQELMLNPGGGGQGGTLNGMTTRNTVEGNLVRDILYSNRDNVNFVHEVYRQAFLLSFSHSPAIKKVITVYKDWIQMNVSELPPFLLEPPLSPIDREREELLNAMSGKLVNSSGAESFESSTYMFKDQLSVRAGLQNVLQIFVTNAANVFLLEVSSDYPILLEEQVEMCKRVLNIYRYMVMNVKMEARTWEQLLFILLQITQLTLPDAPPRRREDTLGGRLAQAIFQTLIVTWIKANLYVVVSSELWDQFLEVLSSLTMWEELIREWAKTMETLTRVLARQVYNLDLNDLPLDRLSERAQKKRLGMGRPSETKYSDLAMTTSVSTAAVSSSGGQNMNTSTTSASKIPLTRQQTAPPTSPYPPAITSPHPSSGDHGADESLKKSASPFLSERSRTISETESQPPRPPLRTNKKMKAAASNRKSNKSGGKGKHPQHAGAGGHNLNRSLSESNIIDSLRYGRHSRDNLLDEDSLDDAVALMHQRSAGGAFPQNKKVLMLKRCKSVDSCDRLRRSSGSGSCSPAPSSGLECGHMIHLDQDTMSEAGSLVSDMFANESSTGAGGHLHMDRFSMVSSTASTSQIPRSVMSGGSVKGWLPDVAVVLWRRMLGSLGNINNIEDATIHAQIYKYLIELFDIMVKIRNNQGVSLDNLSTPKPPEFVPPFTIFAPWCFRALQLPEPAYQRGRLYALRLLCLCTVRPHDSPLAKTHLVQFYKVLHTGLTNTGRMDMMYTLIRFTGSRFFSLMLPGYTAYVLDFLYAANSIISTSDLKGVPRTEATSIVGSLLAFPPLLENIPLLLPNPNEITLISSADVKDQIIGVLLKSGKKEPAGLARCISLSSLGIFVYSELIAESFHPKIKEAIQVLLTALRFNNKAVAQIASDMVLLLSDHVDRLLDYYPEVPKKIVEVLARTLTSLMPRMTHDLGNEEKRLLLSLIACLGEWVMRLPKFMLVQIQEDGKALLHHVFNALHIAGGGQKSVVDSARKTSNENQGGASGKQPTGPAVMINDFDPNIHVDNIHENSGNVNNEDNFDESADGMTGYDRMVSESRSPVRLAARAMVSHFINHLFHFPMETGAASLSSMVSEHDDNPFVVKKSDDLSSEALQSPNVQIFMLNDSTILSLVELPILNSQSLVGIKTATSQVRILLRDISGKFCWDATALYNAEDSTTDNNDGTCDLPNWPPASNECGAGSTPTSSPTTRVTVSGGMLSPQVTQALRHRPANVLPSFEDAAEDLDNLDDMLQYIGHSSPEVLEEPGRQLNAIKSASGFLDPILEKEMIAGVLGQRTLEQDHHSNHNMMSPSASAKMCPPIAQVSCENSAAFQQCRRLFSQLGLVSWEKRSKIHLVKKTDRLLRELKNLDNKRCREAHKIAVIFVGEGQEDKQSILSNTSGSPGFEDFVAGLGWEVELETHTGFMGGLSKSKTTGETSPYFATSFTEIMFHVATRMPSHSDEALITKTRHLGNDEVHIVWSEHWRDYRRGILPTEFCDVLIIVYPLKNELFRIQVSRKPNVPYFGPLYNEVIVDKRTLPGLVRATAINASRAKRSMLPHYQSHYEERFYSLDQIVNNHKEKSTFEDYVGSVYSPAALTNLFTAAAGAGSDPVGGSTSGGGPSDRTSSFSSRPSSVMSGSDFDSSQNAFDLSTSSSTSGLRPRARTDASALLDSSEVDGSQHHPHHHQGSSPKNLKKLTAAIRANINNNVRSRPLSSRDTSDLLASSSQPQSSPPGGNTKRR